ncbi:hypothetical protein EZV62_022655 [Acer yangbiense]|uniref:Helitron helicase-like domain-containing protein n=1 Tax=Acer yangbiense TaxID=1000413 RepID=A0A5C7HBG2_9ROSI|nr:hypothetical protein EZV62_022655 [Acer yangbiense]
MKINMISEIRGLDMVTEDAVSPKVQEVVNLGYSAFNSGHGRLHMEKLDSKGASNTKLGQLSSDGPRELNGLHGGCGDNDRGAFCVGSSKQIEESPKCECDGKDLEKKTNLGKWILSGNWKHRARAQKKEEVLPSDGTLLGRKKKKIVVSEKRNVVTKKQNDRLKAFSRDNTLSSRLEFDIVSELVKMFDECNDLAKVFRMARDRFRALEFIPIRLRLMRSRSNDSNVYNLPTRSEVVALIVEDLDDNVMRDIIVEHKSDGLQRISELHPSFMAMQYPLLFPYGEDGFQLGIKYITNDGKRKTKRKCVTMREYYVYRLQQQQNEAHTIFLSGRLFQQYLVDAYICIEEDRLRWVRLNQPQLRAELSFTKD